MKKTIVKVIITFLAVVTFVAIGFADAVPDNRILLYGAGIIGSLLLQIFLGYSSGVFQDAMDEEDED